MRPPFNLHKNSAPPSSNKTIPTDRKFWHRSCIRQHARLTETESRRPMLTTNTRFYALLLTAILATACSDALLEPSHVGDKTPHLKTTGTDNPQANDQVRPPAPSAICRVHRAGSKAPTRRATAPHSKAGICASRIGRVSGHTRSLSVGGAKRAVRESAVLLSSSTDRLSGPIVWNHLNSGSAMKVRR